MAPRQRPPLGPPKVKAAEIVAGTLRQAIATGTLRPGDRLNSERELQEKFEVSRPTIREALRLLESESLIEVTRGHNGGARVRSLDIGVVARQVGICLQLEGVTLQQALQCRMVIEPVAAGLMTSLGARAGITAMEDNLAASLAALDDPISFAALTKEFSCILTEHSGNRMLHILLLLIEDIIGRQYVDATADSYSKQGVDRMRKLNLRGREKMLELVRTGNAAEAEAFWKKHLEVSGAMVFSTYRAQMPINVVELPTRS